MGRMGLTGLVGIWAFLVAWESSGAMPSETLLPNTTQGVVSIPNMPKLREHWNKTQLGKLLKDPVMQPFIEDLRQQFQERWSGSKERLGLTIEDLEGVPGGEISVALVQPAPGQGALVMLVDVTGNRKKAEVLLEKIAASLKKRGATEGQIKAPGATIVDFTLPKPQGKLAEVPTPHAIYCLKDDLLVVSDNLGVLRGVLGRVGRKSGDSLGNVAAFQAVTKRLKADAGEGVPQVRWFVRPIGYLETVQATHPESQRRRGRTLLDAFKAAGFTAVQGLGGYVDFATGKYEIEHRTAIWAPPPYQKSMKMLKFPNGPDLAPQPWVPAKLAYYGSFYVDVLNGFDNIGPLASELYGRGEPTFWEDILTGLKSKEAGGPGIDLRKELIVPLGNRVSILTDYELPITPSSERLLIAVEAKDEKAVAAGLQKWFKNDPDIRRREFEGHAIWESVPEEKAVVPEVVITVPEIGAKGAKPGPTPRSLPSRQEPLLPNRVITVAHGHLFIASHYEFLVKILKGVEPRDALARSVEYQLVSTALAKFGGKEKASLHFAKTDEQYRPTYELIRQGKMPESETLLGRLLNTVLGPGKKGVARKQEIDGSKLPDFEHVRRHLGPSGVEIVSEEKGWLIKGFLLPK